MIILGLDTFDETTGAALWKDGSIISERNMLQSRHRDFLLTGIVSDLFVESGIKLKDIDGIAICRGPGSFTGLRVGCAYAKGLCSALNKPLIAVGSLEVTALTVEKTDLLIVPMINARGKEVYNAGFKYIDGLLKEVFPPRLNEVSVAASRFRENFICLGSGFRRNKEIVEKSAGKFLISGLGQISENAARIIAELGAKKIKKGEIAELSVFEPEYLQDFPRRV